MTCLYLRLSSPEGFPANPTEFPGSLDSPWHCGGWAAKGGSSAPLGAPITSGTATLPTLSRCLRGHTAAATSPVTVTASAPVRGWWPQPASSQLLPGERQHAPQREFGTECSGFPGPMSLPRTDSLGSTKGPWGISRAKGAAAARRGFLGPTPVGLGNPRGTGHCLSRVSCAPCSRCRAAAGPAAPDRQELLREPLREPPVPLLALRDRVEGQLLLGAAPGLGPRHGDTAA